MDFRRRKVDSTQERDLVKALIISDDFLREIRPFLDTKLFELPFSQTVAKWCLEYYETYSQAPKENIFDIFESRSKTIQDESKAELISSFLSSLTDSINDEYFNYRYALDKAESYLKHQSLAKLRNDITSTLSAGDVLEAEGLVVGFKRVSKPISKGIDVLTDRDEIIGAFNDEQESLISYPGELGKILGGFGRGDLISVLGPMKRGKTWWLIDLGVRGLVSKLKVVFFSLEMQKSRMIRRIYQNFLGESTRSKDIEMPKFDRSSKEIGIFSEIVRKEGLKTHSALKKAQALKLMVGSGSLRLYCYPTEAINVSQANSILDILEAYEGFIPDMVIFDYADILAAEKNSPKEYRHRLDLTWKSLRAMAQSRHCLVATASQSLRSTLIKDIKASDVAEDIRKLAHVSCMWALNQKKEDRGLGVMRVKVIAHRHEEFSAEKEVAVLYNYGIGKAYLDSAKVTDIPCLMEKK